MEDYIIGFDAEYVDPNFRIFILDKIIKNDDIDIFISLLSFNMFQILNGNYLLDKLAKLYKSKKIIKFLQKKINIITFY